MAGIFQSPEWEQFKISTGYQTSHRIDGILVLEKQLPFGRSMLYSPMLDKDQKSKITNQKFNEELKQLAKKTKAIFYRAEIDVPTDKTISCQLSTINYRHSFEEMQPEHTLILDLTMSETDILAQMKSKGRYNIKVAEKNGIEVRKDDNVDNFYQLYSTMAKRQKITYRSQNYYQELIDILAPKGYVEVFTASVGKQRAASSQQPDSPDCQLPTDDLPIASAIVSFYGNQAIYLFGGSSDQFRNLMAPYLVQWEAIKEAKMKGCETYDFFGIAPSDDPRHPWHGVTRFKKQFGGKQVDIAGSYDLVFKPGEYQLFKMAEKIRRG